MTHFTGIVRAGLGDCAQYIERFSETYREATGADLFPGTLNVELECEWRSPGWAWRVDLRPHGGAVVALITPCSLAGNPAFVIRTLANEGGWGDHPRTIVEIAAAEHLRSRHGLADGDEVALDLP